MSILSLWLRLHSCTGTGNPTLEFLRARGSCLSLGMALLLILLATNLRKSTPKLDQRVYLEQERQNLATAAAKAIYS